MKPGSEAGLLLEGVHHFNQILVNHMKDTKAGRQAIVEEAAKELRQWRERGGEEKS